VEDLVELTMARKKKKLISIVTPTFNESENIIELAQRIANTMAPESEYDYEHIVIDNASTDGTQKILLELAEQDQRIKIILNARNFGHIRSPYYGVLQANGDAVILIASDLQDPPEIISKFLREWEHGFKAVMAVKEESRESPFFYWARQRYYSVLGRLSEVEQVQNATGAGLYDRAIVEQLREINDPYPYFRGLIAEIGFPVARVPFEQPRRSRGVTKNNAYTLYDIGVLGITKHSKVPLRMLAIVGLVIAGACILASLALLILKLIFWDNFQAGIAPLMIGVFFLSGVQIMFMGVIGEYVGNIYTHVRNMPLVTEKRRINFD
jgi:glycosyltransferase involved in cell wall biosynthesis